jgi:hypothetical protein
MWVEELRGQGGATDEVAPISLSNRHDIVRA